MPRPDPNFDPDFASPTQWAELYRAYGLQVIPCLGKRPALSEWRSLKEQLVSDITFARWYDATTGTHRLRYDMGLIAGHCSDNLMVIDLDIHGDNPSSLAWWRGVLAVHNNGLELDTWRQRTGSV